LREGSMLIYFICNLRDTPISRMIRIKSREI
jgi:hypothetical protein